MIALVLQARIDSSRLPQKSLLPLGGSPLILRVMQALCGVHCETRFLACPDDSAALFAPLAAEAGFTLITGPKEDVLARFCLAVRASGADRIIRATGDNAFVFADAANAICREALDLGADYAGYSGLPHGAGVEVIASEALLRAEREAKLKSEREHVCPYLYNNPEIFSLHRPLAPRRWRESALRITVDTRQDYERAQNLYERLSALPECERNLGENIIAASRSVFAKERR
jgi:spore coat polysaccharide biosynthesis protein SpsF